jgi:hypothetical protein
MAIYRPASHADAIRKNRRGADANLGVERDRHAAAVDQPGADRSARNAARARRERWTSPNSKQSPRT